MQCGRRAFEQVACGFAGLFWGVSLAVASTPPTVQGSDHQHPRLVVVLYPHNADGSPGNFIVDQTIRETFQAESREHVEVHNEYLDVAFPRNADVQQAQVDYLRRKYAGRDVDVVIAGLSSALDFLLEHGDLFPGVPVIFCAVDHREIAARDLPANVIGVPIRFDLAATLELALRLHPQTETVAVITGSAPMDHAWEREARSVFQAYSNRVEFRYLAGLSLGELIHAVSSLPQRSIIYYLHVFQDELGRTFVPAHVLQTLSERSNVPIYGHVDTYVGRGIVGGRVFSFGAEGRHAARLALRVMAGERPETIGIQGISPNSYMFDARELERWHIPEADLPPGSDILFRTPSFWDRYKWQILSVISLCVLQSALIIGLLIHRSYRRKSEEHLRTNRRQLQQLSNSLIDAQETERRRIARELHDDFNQTLALLSVELDLLRQRPPTSADEMGQRIGVLSDRVRKLSSSMHELSHELHPLKLEQLGLVAAIRSLCQEVSESHGLPIEFTPQRIPDGISNDTALCLYRIVQEALRNVIQHSEAKAAAVRLDANQEGLLMTVADSGIGFDAGALLGHEGLGLISMRERLRLVGGTLSFQSRPFCGTEVHISVPLGHVAG